MSANALSTTSGAVATVVGGGAALGLLQLAGPGDAGYAALALAAAIPYLAAAAASSPVSGAPTWARPHGALGAAVGRGTSPPACWPAPGTPGRIPAAAAALTAISLHRLCYGFLTLMTLLLYRNTFALRRRRCSRAGSPAWARCSAPAPSARCWPRS